MLVNVPQGLVTFDWADGGDIWQDVHPHDNEEVLMEQCKRVKALGTGARPPIAFAQLLIRPSQSSGNSRRLLNLECPGLESLERRQ